MAKNYSEAINQAIENFFREDDWKYQPIDENGIIKSGITLSSKLKRATIHVNVLENGFYVNVSPDLSADEDSRAAVAEFITRANYGLGHGNFEMDYRDGEIRYKTTMYCGDQIPTFDQIKFLFYANIMTLDRYGNALAKVLFGMATPEEAIQEAENAD